MAHPYRSRAAERRRPGWAPPSRRGLVGVLCFVWIISVARLTAAIPREEPTSFEPALAALLVVSLPMVALRRLS